MAYDQAADAVYTPRYKPRAKQTEALAKCGNRAAFAYRMRPRVGKTKTTLDDFGQLELAGKCQDLAVIGPNGALFPWLEDIDAHLSDDLHRRVKILRWRSGAGPGFKQQLKAFLEHRDGPRIFLMNVEALSSVKAARVAMSLFLGPRRAMLAVDEATCIKTPGAARTKFVLDNLAPQAEYRRILSGLLTPKSPLDLFAPYWFLDWRIIGQRSYYAFRNRYAVMREEFFGGRRVKIVVGFRNLEELAAKVEPHSFYCALSDCYDAPAKIYLKHEVELTAEQRRIYDELKTWATAHLGNQQFVTANVVIAQIMRLHQVLCGHVRDEEGNYHEVPESRTTALVELFEEHDPEKAIVWVSYDADIRRVSAALRKTFNVESVAQFWGGNPRTREAEELRFKTDPRCRFMVATAQAGGRGREWSVADLVVYYSNTDNLEFREQSEDRPQAVGKTRPVTYVDLMVPGTVDEKIIKALRAKINLAAVIDGEERRNWLI